MEFYDKKSNDNSGTPKEIERKNKLAEDALKDLKETIINAIGGALLRKDLMLDPDAEIVESHVEESIKILKDTYNAAGGFAKVNDINKNINDIKNRIGLSKIEALFEKLTTTKWNDFEKNNLTAKKNVITSMIEATKPPKPLKPIQESGAKIATLNIQSSNGRTLFKATKQP